MFPELQLWVIISIVWRFCNYRENVLFFVAIRDYTVKSLHCPILNSNITVFVQSSRYIALTGHVTACDYIHSYLLYVDIFKLTTYETWHFAVFRRQLWVYRIWLLCLYRQAYLHAVTICFNFNLILLGHLLG